MRNKVIVIFFILITSCQTFSSYENNNTYEKIGFAEFTKNDDVIHRNITPNSKVKITNFLNKKSLVLEVNKNSNFKKEREIIIPNKYVDLLELNYNLPVVKIETLRTNKTFKADTAKIFEEEKKISQNVEIKNVVIVDLSKNNSSKNNNLNKLIIYYGDFSLKNSALDIVSLLKKEIKNLNPTVIQVNKKFRVKVATINDINEFDIFF
jgi:GTPase SAR1 family protein